MTGTFRKPTPEEWNRFIEEVDRLTGGHVLHSSMGADEALWLFHASLTACGEGASPQAFANVLKGRLN
jgi:hypothetical protein